MVSLQDKMRSVIAEVNCEVAERDELIEYIAIALLTRKNLFILGDTGQAKSYAINEFRRRITGAKQFERLLSKQTDEEQLFGRIDLSSLIPGNVPQDVLADSKPYQAEMAALLHTFEGYNQTRDDVAEIQCVEQVKRMEVIRKVLSAVHGGEPRMITTGKIPDSHICFLDEIFKANDGILNSLLTALNERKYTNEGQTVGIPVISFFSASNEIPNFNDPAEKILRPLYDRFEIKVVTQYVEERRTRLDMLRRKQVSSQGGVFASISLDELEQMQEEVRLIAVPDAVNELMDDILCELRKAGIHISDRKYFNYFPIAQAKAWLSGQSEVNALHLPVLKNYLWTTPNEVAVIEQTLIRMCQNPLQDKIDNLRAMAVDSFDELKADSGNKKAMIKFRGEFIRLFDMVTDLDSKASSDTEKVQIGTFLGALEAMSRETHDVMGFTYASLAELKALQ